MLNVILYEPEIPPNTGNIIRLTANTGARLLLVEPLGFDMDAKSLRRAGLDYREWARVDVFASLESALRQVNEDRVFAFSTRGQILYTSVAYRTGDTLLFGPETRGLPAEVRQQFSARLVRIPMRSSSRSLNLSNAVAVALYEGWRQLKFGGGQ